MFDWFLNPRRKSETRISLGTAVYAIGDIHGRLDLLSEMSRRILADFATLGLERLTLVFLGDYIDRGPNSAGVIDFLLDLAAAPGLCFHALKGNHEDVLLQFLDDPATGSSWVEHGGAETLASYGVSPPRLKSDKAGWVATRDKLQNVLPPKHLAFLMSLDLCLEFGDYFFVHAGVRPGVGLNHQDERDMLWIRDEFLTSSAKWDKIIVHGHTPLEAPAITDTRISLDTGAYATGVLSAVRLVDDKRKIIQVGVDLQVHREA